MSTARVPAAIDAAERARRAERRAAASRYLLRHGHADLLPVLGLDQTPEPAPEPTPEPATARPVRPVRDDVVQDLAAGRRPTMRIDRAELDAAIDILDRRGWSAREVAERLGTTARTVQRRRVARRAAGGT